MRGRRVSAVVRVAGMRPLALDVGPGTTAGDVAEALEAATGVVACDWRLSVRGRPVGDAGSCLWRVMTPSSVWEAGGVIDAWAALVGGSSGSIVQYGLDGDVAGLEAAVASGRDINERETVDRREEGIGGTWCKARATLTGLLAAVARGHPDFVRAAVRLGADLEATDNYGRTALGLAAMYGDVDLVVELHRLGARIDGQAGAAAVLESVRWGGMDVLNALANLGADVTVIWEEEGAPLLHAARSGKVAMLHRLVELGADIHDDVKNGGPLLLFASSGATSAGAMELIRMGVNIHGTLDDGITALHDACMCKHHELALELAWRGADIHAASKDGITVRSDYERFCKRPFSDLEVAASRGRRFRRRMGLVGWRAALLSSWRDGEA